MVKVSFCLQQEENNNYGIKAFQEIEEMPKGSLLRHAFDSLTELVKDVHLHTPYPYREGQLFFFFMDYHEVANLTDIPGPSNKEDSPLFLSQKQLSERIIIKGERYPVLHLSSPDLLSGDRRITQSVRYCNVMDSSIWNYYFSYQEWFTNRKNAINHIKNIFESIVINQQIGLLNAFISTEYACLNSRLIINNYTDPDGHGNFVTPFLFHSEWDMRKKAIKGNMDITRYKWRFLLVDDHARDSIKIKDKKDELSNNESSTELKPTSKLAIVRDDLQRLDGIRVSWIYVNEADNPEKWIKGGDPNGNVEIWGVTSIKGAIRLLHDYKFDIVLLDYLLGELSLEEKDFYQDNRDEESKTEYEQYIHSSTREYGYQLLKRIKKLQKNHPNDYLGPHGRQFFMFISAFTTAVDERLRSESLHTREDYWYIAEGACPTNTPELFKYYLTRLMERRLEQTGINKLSERNILNTVKKIFDTIGNSRKDRHKFIKTVRNNAYEQYNNILSLHYDYFLLQKDKSTSLLADSFLKNKVHMEAMLEHLLQLVHLLAFGTVRQWAEIWEEYKYFERTVDAKDEADKELLSTISHALDEYIINLKSE